MKAIGIGILLVLTLGLVGCNSGREYLPCSTLVVRSEENGVILELKLDTESDWDKVSKCVWMIDGKEQEGKGRFIELSLDRTVSHDIKCNLFVGNNLWCSLGGLFPANVSQNTQTQKEIIAADIP
ncbi:MAG: hypothetical protein ACI4SL_04080 [Candidatus Ornithospirochaeta sp.]